MSQFGRTVATAASSFASKRSYAQNIRLSGSALSSSAAGTRSAPDSPSASAFFPFISAVGNARSSSGTQQFTPGISPAPQPQMNFWTTSPPSSPSQLQFRFAQQQQQQLPPSPSFNLNFGPFTPLPMSPVSSQTVFDLAFGHFGGAVQMVSAPSPSSNGSRSVSPQSFEVIPMSSGSDATIVPARQPAIVSVARKRHEDGKEHKKVLNPFTFYRKTFPARYPHIDALIPTQMERSRLTGAFWQSESPEVRAQCAAAVYVDRTPAQIERLENIRLQTSEKRKAERERAGTNELSGRNKLIFELWHQGVTPAEFMRRVGEHDKEHPLPLPARKRRRKVSATAKSDAAELLLTAETFSTASSSPQPSMSSLSHSPAATFNPELPSAVFDTQETWRPLVNAFSQAGFGDESQSQPDVIAIEQEQPAVITIPVPQRPTEYANATLYDGLMEQYRLIEPRTVLGSQHDFDAIMDAYSFSVPQDNTQMDHDFIFNDTLPTEEDGIAFDVAYFGPATSLSR